MRISVIIPCFNAGPWIAAALRSVAQQTEPPHEILVIDDGSQDNSLAQIRGCGIQLRLLQTPRANGAGARNAGIDAATGDWVALLDADDVWYPQHLERARMLLGGGGDVAAMASHDWIDLDGRKIPLPDAFEARIETATGLPAARFLQLMREPFHFGHSTVLYRMDRLREIGGFDERQRRRHDVDLWLRMIHGHTWAYDSERTVGYRENTPGSISKALVDCEYFHLRALLKNSELYRGDPHLAAEIGETARRLMGMAFVDGALGEFESARTLAWPYLSRGFQRWYSWAPMVKPLSAAVMRWRRRFVMRNIPSG